MKLIDVHAHLTFDRFDADREEVVSRAKKNNLALVILSGIGPKSNRAVLEFSKKHPEILFPSFGVYPVDAVARLMKNPKDDIARDLEIFDVDSELKWIKDNSSKMIAIGEVGLDYKMVIEEEAREEQRKIFDKIIKLAKEIKKPLVIHSRGAEEDVLKILKENNFNNAVVHCFSGRKRLIREGVEAGIYFSVPPVIKRLEHFKTLVELVPLTQLLTETDSPYLSPVAGARNEPANVTFSIEEIAKIKKLSESEVADQIYKNAVRLFNI